MSVVLTCEHGGHRVPSRYRALFAGAEAELASHRGWDPGALAVARAVARASGAPLVAATTTRLLVDLNRSPHNPAVFSRYTRPLARDLRAVLLAEHHQPHWARVRAALDAAGSPALHVAIHSFTPALGGRPRRFDMGILYDPARRRERALAMAWQRHLRALRPDLRVRRNAPYRGSTDGLTTALRRERSEDRYLGVEIELNQRTVSSAGAGAIARALASLLR